MTRQKSKPPQKSPISTLLPDVDEKNHFPRHHHSVIQKKTEETHPPLKGKNRALRARELQWLYFTLARLVIVVVSPVKSTKHRKLSAKWKFALSIYYVIYACAAVL